MIIRLLILSLIFFAACTREPLKRRENALRQAWSTPHLTDDLALLPLLDALKREASGFRAKGGEVTFGPTRVKAEDYAFALEGLVAAVEAQPQWETFFTEAEVRFDFFLPYGARRYGDVVLTSYYEPLIHGARRPTSTFTEPLLSTPPDLVEVAFSRNDERFNDLGQIRGRLTKEKTPRGTPQLVPFYTRDEIFRGALKNRRLEICWVDPIDAFFLHIQGSGTVMLDDGSELRVGYADQNGHPYSAIGKYLRATRPLDQINQASLELHLRALPPVQAQQLMNRNPSYIFFNRRSGAALTANNSPAVSGRTIATDARYFPKGALAFLQFEKPVFSSPNGVDPDSWAKVGRFVLDQDTGGAIRGGGRVDLFWGTGDGAKQSAGVIKQNATLYYLVPKVRTELRQ